MSTKWTENKDIKRVAPALDTFKEVSSTILARLILQKRALAESSYNPNWNGYAKESPTLEELEWAVKQTGWEGTLITLAMARQTDFKERDPDTLTVPEVERLLELEIKKVHQRMKIKARFPVLADHQAVRIEKGAVGKC